jgi:Cytochrome c7 and related cytochrome c
LTKLQRDLRANYRSSRSGEAWFCVPNAWWVFWLFVLGIMLVVLAVLTPPLQAQVSPGPLSRAHHSLDGPTGCVKCHAVSPGSPTFLCLDCHQEIATRLKQKRGLHPVFMAEPKASCVRCHSEHNGINFSLLHWDATPAKFNHSATGFPLDGMHAGLACNKCHNPAAITGPERASLKSKDFLHTYLGLSRSCASCHEDKHKGQLGPNCAQCHNNTDWKDARNFDHSKTKFALTGAHRQTPCQKCHVPDSAGVVKFVGLKFDRCASCHTDPHRGEFKQGCESCHNSATWKRSSFVAQFDHSKTKYPLVGKHQEVACEACHHNGDFKAPVAHNACTDCHKPDPHNGQFLARSDGGRCDSCHSLDGFKPAKFTVADHSKTDYPLRGKHADVACAKCHVPAGRATVFRIKTSQCLDCHQDVHHNQFAGSPYFNRCERCHNENTFHNTPFDIVRHQQTRFALTGGHVAVACIDCHKAPQGERTAVFHFNDLSCTTCHADPHKGEFASRMLVRDRTGRQSGCEACHSTKAWSDLSHFDHGTTGFLLTGSHRAVDCVSCHRPPNLERTLLNVDFKSAPKECEDCHEEVHGLQFAHSGNATRCVECHTTGKWKPSLIDHDKTMFPLKGGHQNVRCGACHKQTREVEGRQVLFYKPTPTQCAACHGNVVAQNNKQPDVR